MSRLFKVIFVLLLPLLAYGQKTWNLGFEEWIDSSEYNYIIYDSLITDRVSKVPENWFCNSDHIPDGTGYSRTTDAYSGKYALVLSGYYQFLKMKIATGSSKGLGWPIDYNPNLLTGYYKNTLLGTNSDSLHASVEIILTKYNVGKERRDTIGTGHKVFKESTEEYSKFFVDVNYNVANVQADTVVVVLSVERFGFPLNINECTECNHTYFDDLTLEGKSGNKHLARIENINYYPNPTQSLVVIENTRLAQNLQVINHKGELLKNIETKEGTRTIINIEDWPAGLYYLKTSDNLIIKPLVKI